MEVDSVATKLECLPTVPYLSVFNSMERAAIGNQMGIEDCLVWRTSYKITSEINFCPEMIEIKCKFV